MTKEEIIEIAKKAGWSGIYTQWAEPTGEADWSPYKVSLTVPVTIEQIEAFAKLVTEKAIEEAHHIIYKSCINQPHWKRSAMRYLKRNAPMLHHQAVHEFNEHPDGRGQE